MRRFLRRIVHNWPLKLAAIGLASLMYAGLAVSQDTRAFTGVVPVRVENQPANTVLLSRPDPVTQIRYYAPPDVPVATSTFRATVDLSNVDSTADVTSVRIEVDSPDGRVRVLSFEPAFATIQLDELITRRVPVKVELGPTPPGLELGPTTIEPTEVTASGAASIVSQVVWARADIQIDGGGISIDEQADLTPIDGNGNAVTPVDLTPSTAHVKIPVFSDRRQKTLPVNPVVTGTPAPGFEIASITVEPAVVTVQGDADQLATLSRVDTLPVPVQGASGDVSQTVGLDLPTAFLPVGDDEVVVTITLRPVTGSRTYSAGLQLVGTQSDLTYDIEVKSVLLTVGGSTAELDRLEGATLVADLDVTGREPGSFDVPVTVGDLPAGTTLVAASPPVVKVTITGPPPGSPSPDPSLTSPAPDASASAAPSGR